MRFNYKFENKKGMMPYILENNPVYNFDFEENWTDVIRHLKTNRFKRYIKKAITSYRNETDRGLTLPEYDAKLPPSFYGNGWGDKECELDTKINNIYCEKYNISPFTFELMQYFIGEGKTNILGDSYDHYRCKYNELYNKYMFNSLLGFQPHGSCHWWNKYVGLPLAEVVMPNERWKIRTNDYVHTTVINQKGTLIFDMLYYDKECISLGGLLAYTNSE